MSENTIPNEMLSQGEADLISKFAYINPGNSAYASSYQGMTIGQIIKENLRISSDSSEYHDFGQYGGMNQNEQVAVCNAILADEKLSSLVIKSYINNDPTPENPNGNGLVA